MSTGQARVLIVITLAETGGAQSYVRDLVPALVERFDVVVAAHGPGPLREAVTAAGARFVALRHVRRPISPRDVLGLVELVQLMRRERPVLVHTNSSKAGVLGRVAAVLARVPVRIFTAHGWAFAAASGPASTVYLWADRLMRPLTSAVVCVSESERSAGVAARTCTPEKTVVIHNAVEVDTVPQASPDGGLPLRVVSVGRIAPPKDFITLLRAVARLEDGAVALTVLGDGPERGLVEAEIEELGLGGTVTLSGDVYDVPSRLAQADVFVLSSRSEGLPISVLEAMAAGLPVVAADVGGLREVVQDGATGQLFAAGDVGALAEKLAVLAADPAVRRNLGEAARERVAARFALPQWRDRHVRLYDELIAGRRGWN
jgi:glycosyltransferase involved in cell wall biosynthesis